MNVILEIPMRMAIQLFRLFVCFPFFVDFRACKPGLCVFRFSSTLPEPSVCNFHKNCKCKRCTVFVIMGGITS